jgi:pyruvate/2-oxoglutarate dehydrogenase complex dihydrolipoamide dehydrogenase (E3) component
MAAHDFDLVVIGAGSGGLTAAGFAAQLGARVALVEKNRIGGDCTWTGCIPSKALLKAAKVAHQVRTASRFGIVSNPPVTDMAEVRAYVRRAIDSVYQFETPEELSKNGVELMEGAARFADASTITVGQQRIRAKSFLITTGARPVVPAIAGLLDVPFVTYEQVFDTDQLPRTLIVVGGGPIGMELAQAYQRFGAQVIVVADRLLPKDEPDVRAVMRQVFEREGVQFVWGRAKAVRREGAEVVVLTDSQKVSGDLLLIASGRSPVVSGLDLEMAGVKYSEKGIPVDDQLRTNVKHIYAAGDVVGGYQFTHLAGWQAFQAVRNALLPGSGSGVTELVPWVTYTDPEVAHIGMTEEQARARFGSQVMIRRWEMSHTDRSICEGDSDGFVKLIASENGRLLGATVVHARAGETIAEFVLAIKHHMKVSDLAGAMHPYPTYSTAVQQLASQMTVEGLLSGTSGKVIRWLSEFTHEE